MSPSNLTDTDRNAEAGLVERCRRGDPGAFEDLYRHHAPRIYALACRMTGSTSEGEDLLQEVFLLVHRKLGSFKGESSLGTWIYRLATNCCLDFLRSRQHRQQRMMEPIDDVLPVRAAAVTFKIDRLDLERAILQLPAGYRAAFVLHDVEGFDHTEVAAQLGIAEGTSKSQVHKARLKIRALLRGQGAGIKGEGAGVGGQGVGVKGQSER
jgi:RNA polymerase sigma-70 factor, ECF subfamily